METQCNGELGTEQKAPAVTLADVEAQIAKEESIKLGEKTTVVIVTLKNGFELVGTSSCVSAKNYDHDLGVKYARKRIMDEIWKLEGYQLQNSLSGRVTLN